MCCFMLMEGKMLKRVFDKLLIMYVYFGNFVCIFLKKKGMVSFRSLYLKYKVCGWCIDNNN